MNIVKNIIKSNITFIKGVLSIGTISFILIAFVGCASNSNNQNIFFKKYYTAPDEVGCLNVFIHKDTVFKNRNTYSATDNQLEYLVLNAKEKESLKNILTELKGKNIKKSYGGGNYDYAFYWEVLNQNTETEVLDNKNPEDLIPLYNYILKKAEIAKRNVRRINNPIYSSININSITEIGGESIAYSHVVKKDKAFYLIWQQLMESNQSDFYNLDNIKDFNYEVNFSYLINTSSVSIEKIYLKKSGVLALKYKDSTKYKGLNLKHTLF